MNKDEKKMIEEMAEIIGRERKDCIARNCHDCWYFGWDHCSSTRKATALYNEGCRKVGKDEIVIKKSEYVALKKAKNDYKQRFESSDKRCEQLVRTSVEAVEKKEQAKKEAVREILQEILKEVESMEVRANLQRKTVKVEELKSYCDWIIHKVVPKTIKDFANKYGIELE